MHTNEKIKRLIEERDKKIEEYNREINNEIKIEKAKYKFSWKRFLLLVGTIVLGYTMFRLNAVVFPDTSIWSWRYWIK